MTRCQSISKDEAGKDIRLHDWFLVGVLIHPDTQDPKTSQWACDCGAYKTRPIKATRGA